MGGFKMISIETSLEQHKEDTAEQIQLVSDSVCVVDQKTDFIIEELRQMRLGRVEKAFQQHKEKTVSQIQSLKESIQALEHKNDLILEELRQLRECPKDFMAPVEATHTNTTTTTNAAAATLTSNESSNSVISELSLEGIEHFSVSVDRDVWKLEDLCEICKSLVTPRSMVVFVSTSYKAEWLTKKMKERNESSVYNGIIDQNAGQIVHWSSPMLIIATDDKFSLNNIVQKPSLVINFDLPISPEKYLHRVGHNGLLERKGYAINFVTNASDDQKMLMDIQSFHNVVIKKLPTKIDDLLHCTY